MQLNWQQSVNKALGTNYHWAPFAKGSSNELFLGRFEDQCIVLRKNGLTTKAVGISRNREALLLHLIGNYSWAPKIILNQPENGWCVIPLYHALFETNDKQILSLSHQAQLIQAISDLQAHALCNKELGANLTTLTINYQQLWDDTYRPIAEARADTQAQRWIEEIEQRLNSLPSVPPSLVHHDLHLGNLALDIGTIREHQSQLILLDWEYGGIGNPWFDAAALARFFHIPSESIAMLPAFQFLNKQQFQTGLRQAIELSTLLDTLWYWARED